jgi:hypothetical protein
MWFQRASVGVTTVLVVLVCALSGCGDSSPNSNGVASRTPLQILAAARAAVAGAATVHVAGSIVNAGKPISLDMELIAGKGGRGRVALDGYSVQLIEADKGAYLNGTSAFFKRVLGAAAAPLGGRWLKAPAHRGNFSWIGSLTNLGGLTEAALDAHGPRLSSHTATLAGEPAVAVSDAGSGGTLYVASTGNPYPLELLSANGGKLRFSHWNQPVTLTPPAGAVSISQLQRHR